MAEVTVVYFAQEPRSERVRVGTGGKNGRDRLKQHAAYGYETVAVIPGTDANEADIHEFFKADRVPGAGASLYTGDRIYEYITWLLARGYAVKDPEDAAKIPAIPFDVWRPTKDRIDEAYQGQLTMITALPATERPAMAHDLVHLSSASDEWATPAEIIEAARAAMGSIDTDPASNYDAQTGTVKATVWYSKTFDGLRSDHPWSGNVWLNPPYGRGEGSAKSFVGRLVDELAAGTVTQAITCLNIASSTAQWFGPIWHHAEIHLIYSGRPNFTKPDHPDSSPSKGVILSYFGSSPQGFTHAFGPMGHLVKSAEQVA